eukprot:scaffold310180_cov30-Tisochrysis_lutea.AAC.4
MLHPPYTCNFSAHASGATAISMYKKKASGLTLTRTPKQKLVSRTPRNSTGYAASSRVWMLENMKTETWLNGGNFQFSIFKNFRGFFGSLLSGVAACSPSISQSFPIARRRVLF